MAWGELSALAAFDYCSYGCVSNYVFKYDFGQKEYGVLGDRKKWQHLTVRMFFSDILLYSLTCMSFLDSSFVRNSSSFS